MDPVVSLSKSVVNDHVEIEDQDPDHVVPTTSKNKDLDFKPSSELNTQDEVQENDDDDDESFNSAVSDDSDDEENDEIGSPVLKRSKSFEKMLASIQTENGVETNKLRSQAPPATSYTETWDYRLTPVVTEESGKSSGIIWVQDVEFQRKLEEFDVFESCDHEVIKIPCPCSNKTSFPICSKCHRVFCCNKCLKQTKNPVQEEAVGEKNDTSPTLKSSPNPTGKDKKEEIQSPSSNKNQNKKQHYQKQSTQTPPQVPQFSIPPPPFGRNLAQQNGWMGPSLNGPFPPLPFGGFSNLMPYGPPPLPPAMMPPRYNLYDLQQHQNFRPMMPPPGPLPYYNNVLTSRRGSRSFTTSFRPPINNENLEEMPVFRDPHSVNNIDMTTTPAPTTSKNIFEPIRKRGNKNKNNNRNKNVQPVVEVEPPPPVVAVDKPVVAVDKPVVAVDKPVVAVDKPVVAVDKPVVIVEPEPPKISTPPLIPTTLKQTPITTLTPPTSATTATTTNDNIDDDLSKVQIFRGVGRGSPNKPTTSDPAPPASVPDAKNQVEIKETDNFEKEIPSFPRKRKPFESNNSHSYSDRQRQHTNYSTKPTPAPAPSSSFSNKINTQSREDNNDKPTPIWKKSTDHQVSSKSSHGDDIKDKEQRSGSSHSVRSFPPQPKPQDVRYSSVPKPLFHPSSQPPLSLSKGRDFNVPAHQRGINNAEIFPKKDLITSEPYITYGVPMEAIYSHGDSFLDFYIWTGFGSKTNESINQVLTLVSSKFTTDSNLTQEPFNVGEYCIAKYTNEDDSIDGWFRGRIIAIEEKRIKVFFIDYGNTERVKKKLVRKLPIRLKTMRPCAIRIASGDFQQSVEDLSAEFNQYIIDGVFRITIFEKVKVDATAAIDIDSGEPVILKAKIELKVDEKWIGMAVMLEHGGKGNKVNFGTNLYKQNEYNSDNFARFKDLHVEIPAKVCHFNNPNDFYIIPEDCIQERATIMEKLNSSIHINNRDPYEIEKWIDSNYICIAKRREGIWARAKIIEVTEKCTVKILFIDFGNIVEVSLEELKSIPVELLTTPQLAYHCSLPIFPTQGNAWDLTDPDVTILQELQNDEYPFLVVVFGFEDDNNGTHMIDVYLRRDKFGGVTKSMLKLNKGAWVQSYEADLDIRKKLHKQQKKKIVVAEVQPSQSQPIVPVVPVVNKIQSKPEPTPVVPAIPEPEQRSISAVPVNKIQVIPEQEIARPIPAKLATETKTQPPPPKFNPLAGKAQVTTLKASKPLQSFMKSEFNITFSFGRVYNFNHLYIKPKEFVEVERLLQDDIYECIDEGKIFTEPPPLNSIVIAKYAEGNFQRAVVTKIINNNKVKVDFIDIGDSMKLSLDKLVPASRSLLKFPKLVYLIKLVDVDDDPKLVLLKDFMELMGKLIKTTHVMAMCTGDQEPYTVSLRPIDNTKDDTVSKVILLKQIWEWEALWNAGHSSDVALLANSMHRNIQSLNRDLIKFTVLPVGLKFHGEISRFTSEGDVFVVNIQEIEIRRDHQVLREQIARFVEKTTSSQFFPKLHEVFLIYINDTPGIREMNIHGVGKWNRVIQEGSEYCRSIDYDEVYPLFPTPEIPERFEIRKLFPELLLRVPAGVVECTLKGFKPSESSQELLQQRIGSRQIVRFTVNSYDEDNLMHFITIDNLTV